MDVCLRYFLGLTKAGRDLPRLRVVWRGTVRYPELALGSVRQNSPTPFLVGVCHTLPFQPVSNMTWI